MGMSWSIVRHAKEWLGGSEESGVVSRSVNAMVKVKDLVQELDGLSIRHAFSQRALVLVGLVDHLTKQTAAELAADSLVKQTHLMSLLTRCEGELKTSAPASLNDESRAVFVAMDADIAEVMATASNYQAAVKQHAWELQIEKYRAKLEALKGLVGNANSPQVWSNRLPAAADWSAIAAEAKKTILKGDYITKVRNSLKAVEEDRLGQ